MASPRVIDAAAAGRGKSHMAAAASSSTDFPDLFKVIDYLL
jgi:hypothetical protein